MEKDIVREILRYLNGLERCKAIKRHGGMFGRKGEPDISVCYRGHRIELEVKQPGENPEPIQKKRLREWRSAGATVGVVRSLDDAKTIIAEVDKNGQKTRIHLG